MFVLEGVCSARFRFYLMVWVVYNFGLWWLWYISRLLDSEVTSDVLANKVSLYIIENKRSFQAEDE